MTAKEIERSPLGEISAGKYRGTYLVYARKSTDEPDNQRNSIAFQKLEIGRYCKRERLPVASVTLPGFCTDGIISEHHSAFKEGADLQFGEEGTVTYRVERPKFHRLAAFLAAGHFKGVVFLCKDRAHRNKGDALILRKLQKAGVDIRYANTSYDRTSAGEFHQDLDDAMAEQISRVTREKVKDAIEKSREKRLCTHKAPVGYLNIGTMERKPLDPERAPIIRQLFDLADRQSWSVSDLRRWAIAQGFTMPPARRRRTKEEKMEDDERDERRDLEKVTHLPTVSMIHFVLSNPFYTGRTRGNNGEWVTSASHEPLVSNEVFARVQEKLSRRRTSIHYDRKLALPFRGFVRCVCGRVYSPYVKKGHTYLGARCDRSCPNVRKSVDLPFVENTVGALLAGLPFTDEERAAVEQETRVATSGLEARRRTEGEASERRARKLREDLAYLADNRLTLLRTGVFTPEALAAEERRLAGVLESAEAKPGVTADDIAQTTANVLTLSELLKTACSLYEMALTPEKEEVARIVFSELRIGETTVDFQCATGFRPFDRRIFLQSALSSWLSELVTQRDELAHAIEELRSLFGQRATQF